MDPADDYWDGTVDHVEELIGQIKNPWTRQNVLDMFVGLLYYAKRRPLDRSIAFDTLKDVVLRWCDHAPEIDDRAREEIGIVEHVFEYVTDEMTEEEIEKMKEEKLNRKNEWLRRTKRKPKTEEEEAKDAEDLKEKVAAELGQVLASGPVMEGVDQTLDLLQMERLLDTHDVMDRRAWDALYRKYSVLDIDLEGKNVLLRLDLDVPLSDYVPPEATVDNSGTIEGHGGDTAGGVSGATQDRKSIADQSRRKNTMGGETGPGMSISMGLGGTSAAHPDSSHPGTVDPWNARLVTDDTLILKALASMKECTDRQALRTFVCGNLGEKTGRYKAENSLRYIYSGIQKKGEVPMHFNDEIIIENWDEKLENEEIPEGCIIMLENLNFRGEEYGV